MKKATKGVATLLAMALLFGCISMTGCKTKKLKEKEIISPDSTWYSTKKINISDTYFSHGNNYTEVFFHYLGKTNDKYCCLVESDEMLPANFDWSTGNYNDYHHTDILVVNSGGEETLFLPLSDLLDSSREFLSNYKVSGNFLKATITQYGDYEAEDYSTYYYSVDINLDTGDISERTPLNIADNSDDMGYYKETVSVWDYEISEYSTQNRNNTYSFKLDIKDSNGNSQIVDLKDTLPDISIYDLEIVEYGDSNALIEAFCDEDGTKYLLLDLSDMTITDICPDGTMWLQSMDVNPETSLNGHVYYSDTEHICELNFESQEITEVFNYNDCNISRVDVEDCNLVDLTDDTIVFTCSRTIPNLYYADRTSFYLYTLTKNDTNPNAGKAVIELGCLGELTGAISDAIFSFNETNTEYFIRYNNSYFLDEIAFYNSNLSYEEARENYIEAQSELSNQIAIDLLSGEAPDIIIDGFGYQQLNNSNYLLDLSEFANDMDSSSYFTNIFEDAKTNSALYQIPLTFSLNGIFTAASDTYVNQNGFTFEEYISFVDTTCNGNNPIRLPQNEYFCKCINAMNDLFIDGNTVNYDNEAFRELAEYVKNEVFNSSSGIDMYYPEEAAMYVEIAGFDLYLNSYCDWQQRGNSLDIQDTRIMGIPSSDGRGPSLSILNSAGISSLTANPDGCWEFISLLLDNSVQSEMAKTHYFPVNRLAFEATANEMSDYYNGVLSGDPNHPFKGMPLVGSPIDSSVVGILEESIYSAHIANIDPAISIIITEEIQPYFKDQKTIDEVIEILQDRVNTVVSERN